LTDQVILKYANNMKKNMVDEMDMVIDDRRV